MSEFKYKIGDRVRIKSIDWYNNNKGTSHCVNIGDKKPSFTYGMSKYCGLVLTIDDHSEYEGEYYMVEDDGVYTWTDEMIEGLVEKKISIKLTGEAIKNNEMVVSVDEYILPEGYIIKDEKGNVINARKVVLEKKKKEYPKTYEECCKVLGVSEFEYNHTGTKVWYRHKLMATLDKLMLCRDAYWKLYGEEKGLGKPWEPSKDEMVYSFYRHSNKIETYVLSGESVTFEFPSAEMRDVFKKNFDPDIEICKEFL